MAIKLYQPISTQPSGSMTKLRAEQIKSEDGFNSLAIDLEALKGQVKDIIGAGNYKEEITGDYANVQLIDLKAHINASDAAQLSIKLATAMTGAVQMNSTLNVDGESTLASATVEDITATHVVFAGAGGALEGSASLVWDGTDLVVGSAKVSDLTSTHVVVAGASGAISGSGALVFDGTDLIAASAKVSDLTSTRVVFAGTDGALVDDAKMTFSAGVLTISGSTFSKDVTIAGNLIVQGDTITANVSELLVEDKNIVVGKDTALNVLSDAGFYVSSSASPHSLLWQYNGGSGAEYWDMSDELRVPDLRIENIVSAKFLKTDAEGDVVAGSTADFGALIDSQLIAGTGVTLSAVDGLGFVTASIGQDVATTSSVTFAVVTGSNLTASRLMASDAGKAMVSADLNSWVVGTSNQVTVAAGSGAEPVGNGAVLGGIKLTLPQDIHTGASPQFAQVKLDGSDIYLDTASGDLVLHATGSGNTIKFEYGADLSIELGSVALVGFTATDIIGALNELKSTTSAASKKSTAELGAPVTAGTSVTGSLVAAGAYGANFVSELSGDNGMVFVNGQLMLSGSSKDYLADSGDLKFSFNLESGDIVVVQKA